MSTVTDTPKRLSPTWALLIPLVPTAGVLIAQLCRSADAVNTVLAVGSPLSGFAAAAVFMARVRRDTRWKVVVFIPLGIALTLASAAIAVGGCCASGDPARAFRIS